MIAVRKVYQKAIVTPMHHIEQLWKDYENFENSVSRQLVTCWFLWHIWYVLISVDEYAYSRSIILYLRWEIWWYRIEQAKGLISEYQPKFNSARAVYRERKKYIDEIDWNMLAVPPTGSYKAIMCFSLVLCFFFFYKEKLAVICCLSSFSLSKLASRFICNLKQCSTTMATRIFICICWWLPIHLGKNMWSNNWHWLIQQL